MQKLHGLIDSLSKYSNVLQTSTHITHLQISYRFSNNVLESFPVDKNAVLQNNFYPEISTLIEFWIYKCFCLATPIPVYVDPSSSDRRQWMIQNLNLIGILISIRFFFIDILGKLKFLALLYTREIPSTGPYLLLRFPLH